MILKAREAWGDDSQVGWINIENPGDAAAMVQIRKAVDKGMVNDQRTVSSTPAAARCCMCRSPTSRATRPTPG